MSRSAPAIPLFGDAYLADTRHLSLEQHGAYLQLMMIAWRSPDCALPNDDAKLARMLGVTPKKWAALKPDVMAFWTLDKAGWKQGRLTKERRFVAEKSKANAAAANARWSAKPLENNDVPDANALPDGCLNDAPPPSPPEGREEKPPVAPRKRGAAAAVGFPSDWVMPEVASLTPKARSCAEQWTRPSYETAHEAFVLHWGNSRKRRPDWHGTWCVWVIREHSKVMRDQKFGNAPTDAAPVGDWSPERKAALLAKIDERPPDPPMMAAVRGLVRQVGGR